MRCPRPGTFFFALLALALVSTSLIPYVGFAAEDAGNEAATEEIDYSRLIFEAELLIVPGEAPPAVTQAGGATPLADGTPTAAPADAGIVQSGDTVETPLDPTAIPRYEGEISGIMENAGPYSDRLREQYESLGELYQRVGDHEKAIANFENAMHIDRVNDGLFTLRQKPLVENIIESYSALNNIDEVDDHQEYLFYIQQKTYDKEDPQLLAAKEAWADWNLESYLKTGPRGSGYMGNGVTLSNDAGRMDYVAIQHPTTGAFIYVPRNQLPNVLGPYGPGGFAGGGMNDLYTRSAAYAVSPEMIIDQRLRRARDMYEEIIESPNEEYSNARGPEIEHKLANIAFAVKQQIDEIEANVQDSSWNLSRISTQRSMNPVVTQGYSKSRERLESTASELEADPASDPVQTAQAYIDLGDLHLAFERTSRARDAYTKAIEILGAAGKTAEEISELFNPEPLIQVPGFALHPFSRQFYGKTAEDLLDYKGYIDATVTVDQSGRTKGVRVIAETENTPGRLHNILVDHLREHRMRPIVQNGAIVDEYPMTLRIHYSY